MDATTLCALMLKAKKVFAKEQSFLSFPISPLPYTPRQLDFFDQSNAAALLESIHHRKEFSTVVDLIATGEAWQPSGDVRLSDSYDSVLNSAVLAVSSRTPDDEVAFQAARAVLHTDDQDSEKYIAYRQMRDAYLIAEQRYTAANLTASSAGPEENLDWLHSTGPGLRRELAELLQAWMFDGFKDEIEAAQLQVATLGARSPSLTWAEWRSHFNPDLDSLLDASDGVRVMPSGFSPANAVAEDAWRGFTLSASEVTALLQEAPSAWLTTMLGSATPPSGNQAMSFEFSSAAIVRPWFDPGLFKARFWKFAQSERMLSDGKTPATGECPAYVAALVFARKVSVTSVNAGPAPSGPFDGFRFSQAALLSSANLQKRHNTILEDATLMPGELAPHLLTKRRFGGHATPFAIRAAIDEPAGVFTPMLFRAQPTATATVAPVMSSATMNVRTMQRFDALKVERLTDRQMLVMPEFVSAQPPPPAVPPVSASPPPAPASPAADTIYVLAFICKPLPQCPNPDQSLQW